MRQTSYLIFVKKQQQSQQTVLLTTNQTQSPLEISTAEQSSDENTCASIQDTRPVERSGRWPLSELLIYPSLTNKQKSSAKSYTVRILASVQSIAFLEEKKRKKLEEEEENKRKKEERAMKWAAKEEEEKKHKALEREAKKVEAQQKRKDQCIRKRLCNSSNKNHSKKQNVDKGLQHHEISPNEFWSLGRRWHRWMVEVYKQWMWSVVSCRLPTSIRLYAMPNLFCVTVCFVLY